VPELGRETARTITRAAVDHDPGTEARSAGQVGESAHAGVGAPANFGQRARRRVVVHVHRPRQVRAQALTQPEAVHPGQVRRRDDDAVVRVHRPADRDADRPGVRGNLLQCSDDRGVERRTVARLRRPSAAFEHRSGRRAQHDARHRPADVHAGQQRVAQVGGPSSTVPLTR
jgi:hypothetical protein